MKYLAYLKLIHVDDIRHKEKGIRPLSHAAAFDAVVELT
jgi:hypothetical protein